MSGMYKPRGGDIIHREPPASIRTGPPSKLEFNGVGRDHFLDYYVNAKVGEINYRLPEVWLKTALPKTFLESEVEVMEVPKTGGCPEQKLVKLNLADIVTALAYINNRLPRRAEQASSLDAF